MVQGPRRQHPRPGRRLSSRIHPRESFLSRILAPVCDSRPLGDGRGWKSRTNRRIAIEWTGHARFASWRQRSKALRDSLAPRRRAASQGGALRHPPRPRPDCPADHPLVLWRSRQRAPGAWHGRHHPGAQRPAPDARCRRRRLDDARSCSHPRAIHGPCRACALARAAPFRRHAAPDDAGDHLAGLVRPVAVHLSAEHGEHRRTHRRTLPHLPGDGSSGAGRLRGHRVLRGADRRVHGPSRARGEPRGQAVQLRPRRLPGKHRHGADAAAPGADADDAQVAAPRSLRTAPPQHRLQ